MEPDTMQRYDLWKALRDALDVFQSAIFGWTQADSRATRSDMRGAASDYVSRLHPVIGHEAAFQFEVAFHQYLDALDRREQFRTTLNGRTRLDEGETRTRRILKENADAALRTLQAVERVVRTKLDEVGQQEGLAVASRNDDTSLHKRRRA
jgi:hypothetical protein